MSADQCRLVLATKPYRKAAGDHLSQNLHHAAWDTIRAKTAGGMVRTVCRGVERVPSRFTLTVAANTLAQLSRLLGV